MAWANRLVVVIQCPRTDLLTTLDKHSIHTANDLLQGKSPISMSYRIFLASYVPPAAHLA